jgi:hypothetical protein
MNTKGINKQGSCVDTKVGSNNHIRFALKLQLEKFDKFINKSDDNNKLYQLSELFAEIIRNNTEIFL